MNDYEMYLKSDGRVRLWLNHELCKVNTCVMVSLYA